MTEKAKLTPDERREALSLEFERLKSRADRIDRFLQGDPDSWFGIKTILCEAKHIGSIELDKAVAEGRQTALAMATVAKALDALGSGEAPAVIEKDPLERMEDELAERRAAKAL